MASVGRRHDSCAVVDCKSQHPCLFSLPSKEEQKRPWLNFIFNGNMPATLPPRLFVCANHFTLACFRNVGEYGSGFAVRLLLIKGSLPTIRGQTTSPWSQVGASTEPPSSRDMACQTDLADTHTVGTQLSFRALQSPYISEGVQATVSCKDFGVGTSSTPEKRPSKRPRLDLEENQ